MHPLPRQPLPPRPTPSVDIRLAAIASAQALLGRGPLFLDTETTGFRTGDEIIEIAIVDTAGVVLLNSLVRPTQHIPQDATNIHGLTDRDVSDAPTFDQLWPELIHLLGTGRPCAIYNAEFDVRLVRQTSHRFGLTLPTTTASCLMKLYARFYGDWNPNRSSWRWQSLDNAITQCGLPVASLGHRALADAQSARLLLNHIAQSL